MSNQTKAVALKYNIEHDRAPIIVASGHGIIAQKMIEIAEEAQIPVYRDEHLSNLLCMMQVGQPIDPDLYELIAKIYTELILLIDNHHPNP